MYYKKEAPTSRTMPTRHPTSGVIRRGAIIDAPVLMHPHSEPVRPSHCAAGLVS